MTVTEASASGDTSKFTVDTAYFDAGCSCSKIKVSWSALSTDTTAVGSYTITVTGTITGTTAAVDDDSHVFTVNIVSTASCATSTDTTISVS